MGVSEDFSAHLKTGHTSVARCWQLERQDGQILGFTDHDRDLTFLDTVFKADTGLTAQILEQSTGLSVDNTEAIGALSDASISEADILSGRFDGAKVSCWLVNWADTAQRHLLFRGAIGEVIRDGARFRAELLGLTETLNRPLGRVFQSACSAVLGDAACGIDTKLPGNSIEVVASTTDDRRIFRIASLDSYADGWFRKGVLEVTEGTAKGLRGVIKRDYPEGTQRVIELWAPLSGVLENPVTLRLTAGCDKRFETCRLKFNNALNFRGFPDLPGEDWIVIGPKDGGGNQGGSLLS